MKGTRGKGEEGSHTLTYLYSSSRSSQLFIFRWICDDDEQRRGEGGEGGRSRVVHATRPNEDKFKN